jgi:hypothetical protein
MARTYTATIIGNRLQWRGDAPPSDTPLEAEVTILEPADAERGRKLADLLQQIADRGDLARAIPDPLAWEREIRKDRPLPGRE